MTESAITYKKFAHLLTVPETAYLHAKVFDDLPEPKRLRMPAFSLSAIFINHLPSNSHNYIGIRQPPGRVMAIATLQLMSEYDGMRLSNFAIHPDEQNRGRGREFLSWLELEAARQHKAKEMRLFSEEKNVRFYEKMDYEVDQTFVGRDGRDSLWMRKSLQIS